MKKILSILLVEDNDAHVELIQRAIEDDDFNIDLKICKSISQAKQVIELNKPNLVITDLNLPDGKGTELISFSQGYYDYPVVLMTSFGDENIAVEAIKSGALDYFVKTPEVFSSMPKLIKRVLREWNNISTRQDAQKKLLAKETEQREILNSIVDGVITVDEHNTILSFNNVAERLFGYNAAEAIGSDLSIVIPEHFQVAHIKGMENYLKTGSGGIIGIEGGIELEGKHKDGHCFPLRLSLGELPTTISGKRRFIGTCQDLTEQKQNEEQLRRSQKMDALGKLTGGIAHDYNNMLGVIIGYSELLHSQLKEGDELLDYVKEITRAGQRGVKLTKKLLSFSRQRAADAEVVDLNSILLDEQHMLEKILTARIKLDFDLTEQELLINIDAGELEDAVVNVSINAMHSIANNGVFTIKTCRKQLNEKEANILQLKQGEYALLSLTDTGSGMSNTIKEQIFEPFYSTKGELGTGLGLSQVYAFVERSNGAIKVESELQAGSCFTLYFPLCLEEKIEDEKNNGDNEKKDYLAKSYNGTENILIVDDEDGLRNLMSEVLSRSGYHVFSAGSGKQALDILSEHSIDVMISDVVMPEMDGYELATIVQENYPDSKILLASGFTDQRQIKMTDTVLHDNLLVKPYTSKELLKKIRELLD